jgi:hypothetical protein
VRSTASNISVYPTTLGIKVRNGRRQSRELWRPGHERLETAKRCKTRTEVPSLHRHYPASAVLRTSPPPQGARPVPHGLPVGHRLTTLWGFPCFVRFPCVHAAATTPAQRLGVLLRSLHPVSLPQKGRRVGLRIVLFEACSAFTRVAACTLAPSPIRDAHSEGFSHFVTSIAAPVASGWSGCRAGLAPTGKRRLVTAHTQSGHFVARSAAS